jgi:hypothetical protein
VLYIILRNNNKILPLKKFDTGSRGRGCDKGTVRDH